MIQSLLERRRLYTSAMSCSPSVTTEGRVLIVFGMSHVGVILRLNKGIGRQLTALAVSLKLPIEVKMIGQRKQLQQRMSLGDVVE